MANNPETISHIQIGQDIHPIDAVSVGGKTLTDLEGDFQLKENMVDTLDNADDDHYPTAKAVSDVIGDLERRLGNI